MKLDFKKMTLAQIILLAAGAAVAFFAFIALIISLFVHGSVQSYMESATAGLFIRHNPLSGLNWVLFLTFFCALAIGAAYFFNAPKSKLIPEAVPTKFIVPGVIVTTFLFIWILLSTSVTNGGFLEGKGMFAGILALLFLLIYVGFFGLVAFEKKDNLFEMLPSALLAFGGLFLLIAVIRCLCYPGMDAVMKANEISGWAVLQGKVNVPSPLGLVKTGMIINSLCFTGWACLTVLNELKKENE